MLLTACEPRLWCPMARRLSGYRRNRPLSLIFDGDYTDVDSSTIQAYLPKLWRHYGHEIAHTRFLSLDDFVSNRRRIHPHAIQLLGQYLCEVDRKSPVSAALSTGLEEIWRISPYRGCDAGSLISEVFVSLGTIFDSKFLGCNIKIFREMESFFQRHCAEIFQETPDYWMRYLRALDCMSSNLNKRNPTIMAPILSSVLHETRLTSRDLRPLYEALRLSRISQRILATLVRKDEQRPSCTNGHGLHLAGSSTTRSNRRRIQSFNKVPLRGNELLAACDRHPMTVDRFRSTIEDSYFGDDFSEYDYPSIDDLSSFDQLSLEDEHHCLRGIDNFMPSPFLRRPGSCGYFPQLATLASVH